MTNAPTTQPPRFAAIDPADLARFNAGVRSARADYRRAPVRSRYWSGCFGLHDADPMFCAEHLRYIRSLDLADGRRS